MVHQNGHSSMYVQRQRVVRF